MKSMKLFLYFMAVAATALWACSGQKNEFIIEGKIAGELKDSVYIYYENDSGKLIKLGDAVNENGEFRFEGEIASPAFASLLLRDSGDNNYYSENQATLIIEPGKIEFKATIGDFMNAVITGGPNQEVYSELMTSKMPLYAQLNEIYNAAEKQTDPLKADSVKELAEPLQEKIKEIDLTFFEQHPASVITAYNLRFYVSQLDYEKLNTYYEKLSPELKNSKLGKTLSTEIKNLKAGSPGSTAANFTTTDVNGNPLSLADFKGKYVIVDFWASWCVPCRKSFPHMIELFNQYKDKGLEVICISDDDRNPDAWKAAIEKDNIGMWHHALRGFDMDKRMRNEENLNDISDKFGIHSLPTKILIGPDGVIIGRWVGEGEDGNTLDNKLKEIFG